MDMTNSQTSYDVATRMKNVSSSAIRDLLKHAAEPGMISLAGGLPAPDLFDLEGLAQASAAVMRDAPISALQYGVTAGQPDLRKALVELMKTRGASVDASETPARCPRLSHETLESVSMPKRRTACSKKLPSQRGCVSRPNFSHSRTRIQGYRKWPSTV